MSKNVEKLRISCGNDNNQLRPDEQKSVQVSKSCENILVVSACLGYHAAELGIGLRAENRKDTAYNPNNERQAN
jgi:hypothetical protein